MYSYVDCYCNSCPQCATVSGAGRQGRPPLRPIPVKRPFQIFGVDVMDLPKTESGNKHVLVFQDFLTKWHLVFPIPDQKNTRITWILVEEILPVFEVPEALLSDRGTNLLSFLMKEVCSLLDIEKLNTRKHAAKFGLQWDKIYMMSYGLIGTHPMSQLWRSLPSYCMGRIVVILRKQL